MKKLTAFAVCAAALWFGATGVSQEPGKNVAHMVYFKLKDASPAAQAKLVAACDKYLTGHPGTVYYSAGLLSSDLIRKGVSDTEWEVGLHLVFKDKAAHDQYQVAERHESFIKENKDNWAKVRVFDAYVAGK